MAKTVSNRPRRGSELPSGHSRHVTLNWPVWDAYLGKRIVVLDPGTHTGVVKIDGKEWGKREGKGVVVTGFELYYGDDRIAELEMCERLVQTCDNADIIVMEDFVLTGPARGGWSSARTGISPARIIHGLLCMLSQRWDGSPYGLHQVWFQMAGQKDVINNDRLKALGIYVAGSEHIRDAIRHAEVWRRGHKKVADVVV